MNLRPFSPARLTAAVIVACLAPAGTVPLAAQAPSMAPAAAATRSPGTTELDAFMEKVLARREVNRKTLDQYVLDETEAFEILGPGRAPLYRTRRDFTWYVRDGMHVRSPVRANGVSVDEGAREAYEARWMRRENERRRREAEKNKEKGKARDESGEVTIGSDGVQIGVGGAVVPAEPRFVSEAYFMDFKFEAGNYYLAGREPLEGQEVLRIEYYPTRLFGDDDEDRKRREEKPPAAAQGAEAERRRRASEDDIERRMNKTSLVTLWVDPAEHQIVKYTFENVWLDFLPGGWLVKVDEMRASMTMGQPFPGVWLPRGIDIQSGITLANGSFEAGYGRTFRDYRLAEVATRMRVPKREREHGPYAPPEPPVLPAPRGVAPAADVQAPPAASSTAGTEVIREIRVHGTVVLTDTEVLDLAGLAVGDALQPGGIEAIAARLKGSRRFESVQVRKRYRSLSDPGDVAIVLVVHENPGVRSAVSGPAIPGVPDTVARPVGRLRSKLMFLPIISFADGYGFTYGGRVSTVDLLGFRERLSVPLTWGGTRRAALEFERPFKSGPLTRVESSLAIWNRKNPRFEIREQRLEVKARAERVFGDLVRAGFETGRSTVSFGALDDAVWTFGPTLALDTRLDPAYPGNAVFLSAGWTGMHVRSRPGRINRLSGDARGYLRLYRQVVLAARGAYTGADAALPPFERLLLGGSSSVRGFRTGAFDGDRTLVTSFEVRAPVTSVMSGARLGVTAFHDAAKTWDYGSSLDAARWRRGVGGGMFLIASVVRINLDVARGLDGGGTRLHLSSGFTF